MNDESIAAAGVLEGACLTLEQLAQACAVSPEWLRARIDEGLIAVSGADQVEWRFTVQALHRVRRMHALERDFDAVPELAALMVDLLEEMDALRARLEQPR
jgi:chaperone modulatory protein CbpM